MTTIGSAARIAFGLFLLLAGSAVVFADVYFMYLAYLRNQNFSPHYIHIGLGILVAFIGGYIIVPKLAEQIADFIITKFGRFVPTGWIGGRRSTDPPPPVNTRTSKPVEVVPDEEGRG